MTQEFFAVTHKRADVRQKSASGGAFSAITNAWFQKYGAQAAVYGCVFDDNLKVRHIRGTDLQDRDRMRGSKYVGSDMTGIMRQVETDLRDGRYVVFSGTPCQISGLKSYLKLKSVDTGAQLLTVEVICHGVGSVRFFEDYVKHLEHRFHSKAKRITFRAKSRPGKKQDIGIVFENGKRYFSITTKYDWFYSAYLGNYILRPSCYTCRFAQKERYADISIADHWGDSNGDILSRSLVVINTEQGSDVFRSSLEYLESESLSFEDVYQINMKAPSRRPDGYEAFWNAYRTGGYLQAQRMLGNHTPKGRFRDAIILVLFRLHLIEAFKLIRHYYRKVLGRSNG